MRLIRPTTKKPAQECPACQELAASAICGMVLLEVALALSKRADEDLKILKNSLDRQAIPQYG